MSHVYPMTDLERALYIQDVPDGCPYLPGRAMTLRFCHGFFARQCYRSLLDRGYRRNGAFLYRPVCPGCRDCAVLRVPVADFRPSKDQRRAWNRGGRRFTFQVRAPAYTPEKAAIYAAYLAHQHERDDESATEQHYSRFLVETCLGPDTRELQLWAGDRLAGVGIFDLLDDALSSVYFYFDPAFARYSPGTYASLLELDLARKLGLRHYYLGYYIADCPAMNYKRRFRPCEVKGADSETWRAP